LQDSLFAIMIFSVTMLFVIWQPRGLSIGWPAVAGAGAALLAGVVTWADVGEVTGIVWNATIALIGIILISLILDELGFFEWAALHMARFAKGNGKRMFLYVVLLGALVSAFFTNDGTALILTPIVLAMVRALRYPPEAVLAFVMASGFIADTTSLPFVVSNLVNILSADYFGIGFGEYAGRMLLPNLFSLGGSLLVLYLYYRRVIPHSYDAEALRQPREVIRDGRLFRLSWVILGCLLAGFFLSEPLGVPVSIIISLAAAIFYGAARRSPALDTRRIVREAPWVVVIFSIGMYVLVWGLHNAGFTTAVTWMIERLSEQGLLAATLGMGYLAAILSSVMNNLPTVMFDALAIQQAEASSSVREALIYANVIGSDLGPKMTPIGSLATLLWLHVLGRKEVRITWGQYFRTEVILTLPTLFAALLGLYISLQLYE